VIAACHPTDPNHVLIPRHAQVIDFDEAEDMLADETVQFPRGEGEVYEHEIVSGKFGQVLAVCPQGMLMIALSRCLPDPNRLPWFSNDRLKDLGGLIFFWWTRGHYSHEDCPCHTQMFCNVLPCCCPFSLLVNSMTRMSPGKETHHFHRRKPRGGDDENRLARIKGPADVYQAWDCRGGRVRVDPRCFEIWRGRIGGRQEDGALAQRPGEDLVIHTCTFIFNKHSYTTPAGAWHDAQALLRDLGRVHSKWMASALPSFEGIPAFSENSTGLFVLSQCGLFQPLQASFRFAKELPQCKASLCISLHGTHLRQRKN
jgi:hypothetical protein